MKEILDKIKSSNSMPIILIGAGVMVICIILICYFSFFYRNNSYNDLKVIMKNASVEYCKDNCENLFEGVSVVTVTSDTLVKGNYMDSFSKLTNDKENNCTGEVVISKAYNGYNYITNLDCGSDYSDKKIVDVINSEVSVVTSGTGLYDINGGKVYRGEYVDNYLKLGSTMFRIVKINSDNTLMLVLADFDRNTNSKWDDRYNSSVKKNDGYNDYSISRARESLINMIDNEYGKSVEQKAISYDYCIGARSANSDVNDGSIECSKKYRDYVSLLSVYDIINASLDSGCKTIANSSVCQNYNYLALYDSSFWTITPVIDTTNQVYCFEQVSFQALKARTKNSLRFVITISGDEIYKSGNGTSSDPYVISE